MFKVLVDNKACSGGDFDYSMFVNRPDLWTEPIKHPIVCSKGYHLTEEPWIWYKPHAVVYSAEGRGRTERLGDKVAYEQIRIKGVHERNTEQFRFFEKGQEYYEEVSARHVDITESLSRGDYQTYASYKSWYTRTPVRTACDIAVRKLLGPYERNDTCAWVFGVALAMFIQGDEELEKNRTILANVKGLIKQTATQHNLLLVGFSENFDRFSFVRSS